MKILLLFICTLAFGFSNSRQIKISSEVNKCLKGRMSQDVEVRVEGEKFKFDPSCSFSFSKSFKTKAGLDCDVRAGMCSSFSPKNKFVVKCNDGTQSSMEIQCP